MELRIKEICAQKGVSQKDLANKLGITYQALFESINGNPKLSRLQDIAEALGVEVTDLFVTSRTSITCPHCGKTISVEIKG